MNRHRHNSIRSGFTVVELLVAMAMSAILTGVLYESLSTAFKAQSAATSSLDSSRTAALAMDLLANDIQNTLQPTATSVLAGTFEGTTTTDSHGNAAGDVVFYTNTYAADHVDGNGEVKEVELTVEAKSNGEQDLVRRVSGNLLSEQGVTPDEETVCRNVAGFTLRYYTGSDWQDTWDSTQEDNTVPAAVEVTLQLQPPGSDPRSQNQPVSYVRVFPISCSTAVQDTNVNTGGTSSP
jgi:type II secretion system protein J